MTYATMAASGQGRLVIWLRIAGYPWVFGTENLEPAAGDAWYWNGAARRFTGVKPWMSYAGIQLEERADFVDGTLDVAPVDVELVDVGGELTAMLSDAQYRVRTRLAVTLTDVGLTATVDSTTGFAAAGTIWIGTEAMDYTGLLAAPPRFDGLTRGALGTVASEHAVDLTTLPVVIPIVTDGPTALSGRRANLYVAEVDSTGTVSASECLYRGSIGPDADAAEGVYRLKVDHIAGYFSRKVGQRMPSFAMRAGYSYSGGKISTTTMTELDFGAFTRADVSSTISGYIAADWALASTWRDAAKAALIAAGTTRSIEIQLYGERWRIESPPHAGFSFDLTVVEGDPLWALGFNPGLYQWDETGVAKQYDAQNDSRLFVGEVARRDEATKNLQVQVTGGIAPTDGLCATIGNSAYQVIESVTNLGAVVEGDYIVDFEMSSVDRARDDTDYIAINDAADLVLRHVFAFGSGTGLVASIKTAMWRAFHTSTLFPEPAAWCVTGLEGDDFDFDELDAALIGVPTELQGFYDAVSEPISVGELILDRLALVGIAPRITRGTAGTLGGKIGFAVLETPHDTLAESVEINSAMWAIVAASKVQTAIEGQPILNNIAVRHSYDYRSKKWAPDTQIAIDPFNVIGKTRSADYACRGLVVADDPVINAYDNANQLAYGVCDRALGMHFGVLGRVAPEVTLDCTWTSRQLLIGDIVKVTHPCVVDVATGEVGIISRLGIVTGRVLQVTDDGLDRLTVLLPPEINVAPISPCALATTWNPGTLTLTGGGGGAWANYYCRTGETDLTYIDDGHYLRFTEYGVEAPATFGAQKVDSVGANSIVLDADPFGGAFPANGVWCHYANFDECTADQQAWLFFGDTTYSLGLLSVECQVWAL